MPKRGSKRSHEEADLAPIEHKPPNLRRSKRLAEREKTKSRYSGNIDTCKSNDNKIKRAPKSKSAKSNDTKDEPLKSKSPKSKPAKTGYDENNSENTNRKSSDDENDNCMNWNLVRNRNTNRNRNDSDCEEDRTGEVDSDCGYEFEYCAKCCKNKLPWQMWNGQCHNCIIKSYDTKIPDTPPSD